MLVILVKMFHEQPINEVHAVSSNELPSSLESECVIYFVLSLGVKFVLKQ